MYRLILNPHADSEEDEPLYVRAVEKPRPLERRRPRSVYDLDDHLAGRARKEKHCGKE